VKESHKDFYGKSEDTEMKDLEKGLIGEYLQ
jgi:hypothetical protein